MVAATGHGTAGMMPLVEEMLQRAATRTRMGRAIDRMEELFSRDKMILRSLVYSLFRGTPKDFPQTMGNFMMFLTEPRSMDVFIRMGRTYRGLLHIEKENGGAPKMAALRDDFEPDGDLLARSAIENDRVVLKTRRGRLYWVERDEGVLSVEQIDAQRNEESVMVVPFGRGVMVASGKDLTFGGLFFPARKTIETTAVFSKIVESERNSKIDPLTGLTTRREYYRMLDFIARNFLLTGENVALAGGDIDHFGRFNKDYGAQAGDAVLVETAKTALDSLRFSDVIFGNRKYSGGSPEEMVKSPSVFRLGGEEISLLLIGTDEQGGAIAADRFREMLESKVLVDYDGSVLRTVTISIGVTSMKVVHEALLCGIIQPPLSKDDAQAGRKPKPYALMDFEEKADALSRALPIVADQALRAAKVDRNSVVIFGIDDRNGAPRLTQSKFGLRGRQIPP